jgi:hypothetical protein
MQLARAAWVSQDTALVILDLVAASVPMDPGVAGELELTVSDLAMVGSVAVLVSVMDSVEAAVEAGVR